MASNVVLEFLRDSPFRIWTTGFVIGAVLELFARAEKNQPWSEYFFNVRYGLLYAVITWLITPALNSLGLLIVQQMGGGWFDIRTSHSALASVAVFGFYLFINDFLYYWWHRSQHTFGPLWDQHSLHHSPKAVNVTTAVYHHWSEGVFQTLFTVLPFTVLFKMDLVGIGLLSTIISFWQYFIHANWRLPMGPLAGVIAGPQWHRIHHSRLPQHMDKNFAAHFPVWDRLFGTYWSPATDEYPPTGIHDGTQAATVFQAALWPFPRLWQRFLKVRR